MLKPVPDQDEKRETESEYEFQKVIHLLKKMKKQ
jgi:hypothetical protein